MKAHRRFSKTMVRNHFSQKEKKRYPFLHIAMASFMQIPDVTITGLPVLTADGQHSLHIENYTSVLIYETNRIVLLCTSMSITILGENLRISRLNQDEIHIEGFICSISYSQN